MIVKGSVRRKSKAIFQKVILLRKQGYSYTEIKKYTGVAKSTINNWVTFAGLTLTKDHLLIQKKKRLENHVIATEASRITRLRKKEKEIQNFIQTVKKYFNDPFFVGGIMLYEAEGTKGGGHCGFSNSDYRIIKTFVMFLKKYLNIENKDLLFRLYIHDTRKNDLIRIKHFWIHKLKFASPSLKVNWKHNTISKKRENLDYVGQINVQVSHQHYLTSKILAVSDIILSRFSRLENQ